MLERSEQIEIELGAKAKKIHKMRIKRDELRAIADTITEQIIFEGDQMLKLRDEKIKRIEG